MGLAKPLPYLYDTEYLAHERASFARHEFLDGISYLMAGESPNHSRICINLAREVSMALKGRNCEAFSPNMKVRTRGADLYSYPDLTVVCGTPRFHDLKRDVLLNPTVVFEVLSDSTESYDRGEKALRYQNNIDSLRAYVLVAQEEPQVTVRLRDDTGGWHETVTTGLDAVLDLEIIDCRLPLAEIYDRVTF